MIQLLSSGGVVKMVFAPFARGATAAMIDTDNNTDDGAQGNESGTTAQEWKSLATHPDLERDLGYEAVEWEVIKTPSHSDHHVYLPSDDELLEDATFIVTGPEGRCNLADRR